MQIIFNEEEQGLILKASHSTPFSTGRVAGVVKAIYEANLEEDLKSAIEHLEEVEAI